MTFTSWLKRKYPESSNNSAETYSLIKKAKTNKQLSIIAALLLVYLITFYTASKISSHFGEELTKGTIGIAIYAIAFVVGSSIFISIRNHLVKNEIKKLLNL